MPGKSYFNFLGSTVELNVSDVVAGEMRPVLDFFRFNLGERPSNPVTFSVNFEPYGSMSGDERFGSSSRRAMRRSSAPEFDIRVNCVTRDGRSIFHNSHTWIDAPEKCGCAGDVFVVGVSSGSTVMVIDFLRDLIIRHQEDRGRIVLHASGVLVDGRLVAVAGEKGAGKTTSLLHALGNQQCRYFSGDKIFIDEVGEELWAYPWRDWPYIGAGTLRKVPWLAERLKQRLGVDLSEEPDRAKFLIDPDAFEVECGGLFASKPVRLERILFPRVDPSEPNGVTEIMDPRMKWARVNQVVERLASTTFFHWQSYLVPDYRSLFENLSRLRSRFERLRMFEATGTLEDAVTGASLA